MLHIRNALLRLAREELGLTTAKAVESGPEQLSVHLPDQSPEELYNAVSAAMQKRIPGLAIAEISQAEGGVLRPFDQTAQYDEFHQVYLTLDPLVAHPYIKDACEKSSDGFPIKPLFLCICLDSGLLMYEEDEE